jgi:hypothetical protein
MRMRDDIGKDGEVILTVCNKKTEEYFSRATVSNSMVFTLTTPFNADSDAPLAPSSLGMNVKLLQPLVIK